MMSVAEALEHYAPDDPREHLVLLERDGLGIRVTVLEFPDREMQTSVAVWTERDCERCSGRGWTGYIDAGIWCAPCDGKGVVPRRPVELTDEESEQACLMASRGECW